MDDPVTRGHAFVVGDLWRPPSLFPGTNEHHDSIFEALDTSTRLHLPKSEDAPHFTFDVDLPDLPDLDDAKTHLDPPANSSLPGLDDSDHLDIWNTDTATVDLPKFSNVCTWEAFDGKSVANAQQTAFLSEAGPTAFNALDSSSQKDGVLPQDYTLRALCSLALGRSSTLFQWSEDNRSFSAVLPGICISGLSQTSTESISQEMIELGTAIVRMRQFGETGYSRWNTCAALVAMQNSVLSILDAIDGAICGKLNGLRSILQLQRLVKHPRKIVLVLSDVVALAKDCTTDESLISSISDRIYTLSQTSHDYSSVFRALLARTSVPWLERLATDLGLCSNSTALAGNFHDLQTAEDLTKEGYTFLDDTDIELIHETKVAVNLLRSQEPTHTLLGSDTSAMESPLNSFTNSSSSIQQTSSSARLYEMQVMQQLVGGAPKRIVAAEASTGAVLDERTWQNEVDIAGLESLMSQDLDSSPKSAPDELYTLVMEVCRGNSARDHNHGIDLSISAKGTPLERVRPFITTQHRLVNGVLLRQLLRDNGLRQHLEQQKQFQLFGNGDFVARLSIALFSLDVQSAERKRGVVPTGEVMGLRLGSSPEQRWPPASSELRLTLAGVLEESRINPELRGDQKSALSFAIRELPEEDIDRVLDVHSVYALDFLRLQYVPVAPLDAVLTAEAIQQYDAVFRFLLKLLRQIHVVKDLPRKTFRGRGDTTDVKIMTFANESHHFVSVLVTHVMELGINAPWQVLIGSIEQLERALDEEDKAGEIGTKAAFGIQGLRHLHEACLDRIRTRLFLKRKHTKLCVAIEGVFAAILKCAAALSLKGSTDKPAFEEQYVLFQQAMSQLCELLLQVVEKPPKAMTAAEAEDSDTIRTLMLKLNWNGFYTNV